MSDLRDKMEGTRSSLLRSDSMLGRSIARTVEPLVDHVQFCLVNLHDRLAALERADDPRAAAVYDGYASEILQVVTEMARARIAALAPAEDLAYLVLEPHGTLPPVSPVPFDHPLDHRCLQEQLLQRTREVVRSQTASYRGVALWGCLEEYVLRALTEHAMATRPPEAVRAP